MSFVSTDEPMPEIATNEEWRGIMVRARKAHELTQKALGDLVGLTQVMISKIESGEAASSTYVLRICRELDIPEPANFTNDDQREWWQFGHLLRQRNPEGYAAAKQMMRTLVKQLESTIGEPAESDKDRPSDSETQPVNPRRK